MRPGPKLLKVLEYLIALLWTHISYIWYDQGRIRKLLMAGFGG